MNNKLVSSVFLLIVVVSLLSLLSSSSSSSSFVAAASSNPCTKGWTPGNNYSSISCDTSNLVDFALENIVNPAIFIAVGVLIFFFTILAIIFRYCCQCCGGSKQRPGHFCCGGAHWDDLPPEDIKIAYDPKSVLFTKVFVVIGAILGIVAAGVSFARAGQVSKLPDTFINGATDFADWVIAGTDEILNGLPTSSSTSGDFQDVRDAITTAKNEIVSIKDSVKSIGESISIVGPISLGLAGPTVVIALAGIAGIICMILSVRNWIPFIFIALTCLVCVPTGGLGGVGSALTSITGVWCDEVDAFKAGQFGVFNNYFVPEICEDKLNISSVRSELNAGTSKVAYDACVNVRDQCSPQTTVDGRFYRCDNPVNCTQGTTTVEDVNSLISSLTVKTGTAGSASCSAPCTISKCATDCDAGSNVKDASETINTQVTDGLSVISLINRVAGRYLDCRTITLKLINVFDICSTVHAGLSDVVAGAAVGLTSGAVLIISLFLGQKRFFSRSGFNREEAELTLIARY